MADFGMFKLTNVGRDLLLEAQTGETLNFTKFVLGDGSYTGDIENLTALVNPIREEEVTRLNITTVSATKHVQIGFNLNTTDIQTGFYLREIGVYAEDPNGGNDILVYYGNAGDTADYIAPSTSSTLSEKLIDVLVYISNVNNITAVIDTSMVYATESDIENLQEQITLLGNNKANNKKLFTITVLNANWSATAPYTQTITTTGILATDIPYLYPIYSNTLTTRQTEKEEYNKISMISSNNDSVTITCDEEIPTIDLDCRVEVYY